ncbi:hypothetical protein SAMN02746095_03357 [Acidocella aminolytica 101 = DSM 11237]|nr:hypothetical protein [Acidocella aminolytica]SHF46442.1 hypothetical protein SAMN02746095_03357 [Acidocella aminolytica 101 = DSM 11237]
MKAKVAGFRDVALEDLAFVIDNAPQIKHLSIELYVHLAKVPLPLPEAPHSQHALPLHICST